uniref:Uncharacterized protein n=1 Tax=Aegilops tauschii subsp. strangulata TaxID=200361 RepID=A0A453QZK6_AEGTS
MLKKTQRRGPGIDRGSKQPHPNPSRAQPTPPPPPDSVAMALRSPSSTSRQDLSPPADSLPPISQQGGSSNGAKADVARKKEVDHLLAKLKKEGVEIDGNIASIIDDEMARIKAEAERASIINGLKRNGWLVMLTITSAALGFLLGGECYEKALYAQMRVIFGEEE